VALKGEDSGARGKILYARSTILWSRVGQTVRLWSKWDKEDEMQRDEADGVDVARASAWVRAGQEALGRGAVLEAFVWFERVMRDYNHLEQAEAAAAGLMQAEQLAPAALEDARLNQRLLWILAACCAVLVVAMVGLSWTAWRTHTMLGQTAEALASARAEGAALEASRDEAIVDAARARAQTQRTLAELAAHQLSAEYMYQRAVLAEAPADGDLKALEEMERADAEARRLFEHVASLHPDSTWATHAKERIELLALRHTARREALKQAQRPFEAKLKQCRSLRNQLIHRQNLGIPVNPYTGDVLVGLLMEQGRETGLVRDRLKVSIIEAEKILETLPDSGQQLRDRLRTACKLDRLGETLVE
jgi:hypothetical protein